MRSQTLALWTIVVILLVAGGVAIYELKIKPDHEFKARVEACLDKLPHPTALDRALYRSECEAESR
jgi:cytochrome c-type biogenesis protein CcmH/NrfF